MKSRGKQRLVVANIRKVKPVMARDGVEISELLHPKKGGIKNLTLASGTLLPKQAAAPHFHKNSEEIYYVLSGQGMVRVGVKSQKIAVGDAIFLPKGISHSLKNTSTEPLKVLAISSPAYSDEDIFF